MFAGNGMFGISKSVHRGKSSRQHHVIIRHFQPKRIQKNNTIGTNRDRNYKLLEDNSRMNNKEISALKGYAICLFMAVLVIALGFMFVKLKDTQERLAELERGTNRSFNAQQNQIDGINADIDELSKKTDKATADIEQLGVDLKETQAVQSTTNKALNRLRKQTEQESQELREELKKD